jgi:LuxR family transcriptional activator of conjugal transfer of Ti plasmids
MRPHATVIGPVLTTVAESSHARHAAENVARWRDMDTGFRRLFERLHDSRSQSEACEALQETTDALDLNTFTYCAFPREHPAKPPIFISTVPGTWLARYTSEHYYRLDPMIPRVWQSVLPFAWGSNESFRGLDEAQLRIFSEGREFGIHYCFSVPIHAVNGRIASMSFCSQQREADFLSLVDRLRHELHLTALHFHANVQRLEAQEATASMQLSPREVECLQWVARGKTRWQIARIVGISERTVGFHLDNAKRKLAVGATAQAVAKSVGLGLLAP